MITYHLGYDLFTPDSEKNVEYWICPCCSSRMDVNRKVPKVNKFTGHPVSGYIDEFTCPNYNTDWHRQIIALMQLEESTPSRFIAENVRKEIDTILQTKTPTKKRMGRFRNGGEAMMLFNCIM